MSENTLKVKLQNRNDNEANWIEADPVLLKGEIAISSDKNNMYKVGDGEKKWSELEYNKAATAILANHASSATSALSDTRGQQIDTTYVAGVNVEEISDEESGTKSLKITVSKGDETSKEFVIPDKDTTYDVMTAPTSTQAGTSGLVPAPGAGDAKKFLMGDGSWGLPSVNGVAQFVGATAESDGENGVVPAPLTGQQDMFLKGDGTWGTPENTTYSEMTGATSVNPGKSGLVPAPLASTTDKFLSNRGEWVDVSVEEMTGANSYRDGKSGLVPAPVTGEWNMFLKGDGTWATPENTTYSAASPETAGFMRLYSSTGQNTDGTMTQDAIRLSLDEKADCDHKHNADNIIEGTLDPERLADTGITAGEYTQITVDAKGRVTAGSNPTTLTGYGIIDAAAKSHVHSIANITNLQTTLDGKAATDHTHISDDIESLDASKLTGIISIDRLPSGALERCIVVADDTARLALNSSEVQNGDTVKVTATGLMYLVKDQSNLGTESAFEQYTAGSASSVPWSGVTGKPSTFNPSSHTHTISDITNLQTTLDGKAATDHTHNASDINAGTLSADRLPTSGVTAGTYRSVTVDKYGRVTGGTNPTTLAGYGITDAAAKTHTHTISDITNLQTTLDGKAATDHTHNASDINAGTLSADRLPTSGVTAGTYRSVTVDKYGRVTGGTNPTTLAGYGITDAAAKTHTHTISDITNLQTTLDGKAATDHTHNYLPLSGGTLTGNLTIKRSTESSNAYGSSNPTVTFSNSDGSQVLSLIFTDYDAISSPSSLTLIGNAGGEYLIVPNFKATGTIYEGGTALSDKYQAKGNYAGSSSSGGAANSAVKWSTARNINGMSVNGEADRVNYGTCSTAADTAAKTVECTGFTLITGAEITVKFTITNTAASPTLNVNSTGAKAIYYRGSAISAGYLAANRTYTFRYNGTQWDLVGDLDTNTNNAVTQTITTTNADYRVLFSVTADDTTRTEGARKAAKLLYNPSTQTLYSTNFAGAMDFGDEG